MLDTQPTTLRHEPMPGTPTTFAPPLVTEPTLRNSVWYGSALISLLASAEETGGHYTLLHVRIQRGFGPPPHRHSPEAFYLIRGRIRYDIDGEEIVATAGQFVQVAAGAWHTFTVESDEAEYIIIFSPPGVEQIFFRAGSPAAALELPAGRVGPPQLAQLLAVSADLGIEMAPPGTTTRELARRS